MTSIQRHKTHGAKAKRRETRLANRKPKEWGYLVIWVHVLAGMEKRFEKGYGPEGGWVRLFDKDQAYIRTELIHHFRAENLKDKRTYLTLDFWASQQAYDKFRKEHIAEYKALDLICEKMAESEREIGRFVRVSQK